MVTDLCSAAEWSGSGIVADQGSPNTVRASSNETPCFRRFARAFASSHSKTKAIQVPRPRTCEGNTIAGANSRLRSGVRRLHRSASATVYV